MGQSTKDHTHYHVSISSNATVSFMQNPILTVKIYRDKEQSIQTVDKSKTQFSFPLLAPSEPHLKTEHYIDDMDLPCPKQAMTLLVNIFYIFEKCSTTPSKRYWKPEPAVRFLVCMGKNVWMLYIAMFLYLYPCVLCLKCDFSISVHIVMYVLDLWHFPSSCSPFCSAVLWEINYLSREEKAGYRRGYNHYNHVWMSDHNQAAKILSWMLMRNGGTSRQGWEKKILQFMGKSKEKYINTPGLYDLAGLGVQSFQFCLWIILNVFLLSSHEILIIFN